MSSQHLDSFGAQGDLQVNHRAYEIFRLQAVEKSLGVDLSRLPVSLKILLENLLRCEDGRFVKREDVEALADGELTEYVTRSGKVLFGDNCAACHGTNGVGTTDKQGLFAPILNDDDWLFGGTIDDIHMSITDGRQGMMMAHKDMLSAAEIDTLANAVAAGTPTATPLFAEKGCTACHGEDGKGMAAMGSANLTDKVYRFDGSLEGIKYTIANGVNAGTPESRVAVMPSFKAAGKLSDAEMKKLAVYVYKFGGGQAAAPVAMEAAPAEAASAVEAAAPAAAQ